MIEYVDNLFYWHTFKHSLDIYGATKIYDTRSGIDPLFPENLLEDKELLSLVKVGEEFGTTTGRMRKTNWLNLDKLVDAVKISGITESNGVYTIVPANQLLVELSNTADVVYSNTPSYSINTAKSLYI